MFLLSIYRFFHLKIENFRHFIWRKKIKQSDFTLISNNCWGGVISQYLKLKYNSPTVGLILFPEDYIKFCTDLKKYLSMELEFIELKDSKMAERFQFKSGGDGDFPVGILGDIEIYFMHYSSTKEADEKWNRRKERINWNKILLKVSERDGITEEQLRAFSKLPYKKVIFTQKLYHDIDGVIYTPGLDKVDRIGASEVGLTLKSCDIVKVVNNI